MSETLASDGGGVVVVVTRNGRRERCDWVVKGLEGACLNVI